MADVELFLQQGELEIEEGRRKNDATKYREGAEKVFHALVEACSARIQKYGLPVPHDHSRLRDALLTSHDEELRRAYENAFDTLHAKAYYRGWIDPDMSSMDKTLQEVRGAIDSVRKRVRKG